VSAECHDLRSTSRVESPLVPSGVVVDDWFNMSVGESLDDLEGGILQGFRAIAL